MPEYSTRPLDAGTWQDFAELVEAHNGVWGGCWCMAFHPEGWGGTGASAALAGALEDRKVSASFLHNGTVAMFERQGFERTRRIGQTRWVVRKVLG